MSRRSLRGYAFQAALALWLLFGVAYLAGFRDWVSVLSGTPVSGVPFEVAVFGGALYVLSHFGATLIAPIVAIAACLGELALHLRRRPRPQS